MIFMLSLHWLGNVVCLASFYGSNLMNTERAGVKMLPAPTVV
jgi:hypothetical protein